MQEPMIALVKGRLKTSILKILVWRPACHAYGYLLNLRQVNRQAGED
jgi:hypothetical protein